MASCRLLRSDDSPHLVCDGEQSAAEAIWNMQFDAELLDDIIANRIPPTLRLYQWKQPAMTVGRFQNIERTVNQEFCQQHDIPIVRRITGGRGILHGTDLTITLAAPIAQVLPQDCQSKGISQIYAVISDIFLTALCECGINAQRGSDTANSADHGSCFALHSSADIIAADGTHKLLGAALHRSGDHFLMQASVPRSGDENLLAGVFEGISTSRALPSDFDLGHLERAFIAQFTETFGILLPIPELIDRNSGV